jgi:hypothetical protein
MICHSNFFVWARAAGNKHYLVALSALMALLALSFQPLAAALLTVRNVWLPKPGEKYWVNYVLHDLEFDFGQVSTFSISVPLG